MKKLLINSAFSLGSAAALAVTYGIILPSPARAEQPTSTVSEVVVTVRKRPDLIQNVPQSVSAVTDEQLQKVAAGQLEDYFNYVPGLNFLSNGQLGQHEISLRGVTTGLSGSPTVGIYVDDVPFGSTSGFAEGGLLALDLAPFDLARIEVLRGPQGTLYGSNTLGGLLKYVTNQPNSEKFEGFAEADASAVSSGDAGYGGKLMLNVPLAEGKAALRVSAYRENNPGWIDDVGTGARDVNRSTETGGRAALLLTPTEALSIKLSAILQDISTGGSSLEDVDTTTHTPISGELEQSRNIGEPFKERFRQYAATVKYDFSVAQLVSVTSYQTLWSVAQADETPAFGIPSFAKNTVTNDKFYQELRIVSPEGKRVEWLLGTSYDRETGGQQEDFEFLPPIGIPLVYVAFPSTYRENAVFGDLTWHVTPRLDVALGGRWNKNTQSFSVTETGAAVGPDPIITTGHSSDSTVTWLFNPSYHVSSDLMVYGRVATGFRPGGPNVVIPGQTGIPPTFAPDKTTNYEVGVKSDLLDKRATLDVSVFDIEWKDIQLLQFFGGFSAFGNGSQARSRGVEVSASYRPVAGLDLGANAALTDAVLTGPAPAVGGQSGDHLPNVPRYSGAVTADYSFPVGATMLGSIGLSERFVGARDANFSAIGCPTCSAPFRLRAYNALDLRIGIGHDDWRASVLVKNVANTRGELTATTPPSVLAGVLPTNLGVLEPRTVALTLTKAF